MLCRFYVILVRSHCTAQHHNNLLFGISRAWIASLPDTLHCDCRRTEVSNLLESAGFSRSNPYYVVQQGKASLFSISIFFLWLNPAQSISWVGGVFSIVSHQAQHLPLRRSPLSPSWKILKDLSCWRPSAAPAFMKNVEKRAWRLCRMQVSTVLFCLAHFPILFSYYFILYFIFSCFPARLCLLQMFLTEISALCRGEEEAHSWSRQDHWR